MSCPHATTTTILWVNGDGPEEHLHHVVACDACQAVLEDASEVAPFVRMLPAAVVRRRRWPAVLAGTLALAAAVLLFARVEAPTPAVVVDTAVARVVAPAVVTPLDSEVDARLDDLDLALDALEHDLSTL